MNFGSDNVWGASAPVLEALVLANAGAQAAYGEDEGTKRRRFLLAALFVAAEAAFFYFLAQVIAGNVSLG